MTADPRTMEGHGVNATRRSRPQIQLADTLLDLARTMRVAESRLQAALEEAAERGELERVRLLLTRWRSLPLESVVPQDTADSSLEPRSRSESNGAPDGT